MESFDHILNWRLKEGSHQFPGKDGGTCINEAAVVAAGFKYRPIRSPKDMPDCFSRPICGLAMRLNDQATDDERQQLLPFVTRLACADGPQVEREREAYINARMHHSMTFEAGVQVLDGVLAIGRQADGLAPAKISGRMAEVQRVARTRSSVPDNPSFAKIKKWLGLTPDDGMLAG